MSDSRYYESVRAIGIVHDAAPAGTSLKDRLAAIDAAYPFGERKYWPYKMWLKARREYIARWSDKPAGPLFELPASKLDRYNAQAIADALERTIEE